MVELRFLHLFWGPPGSRRRRRGGARRLSNKCSQVKHQLTPLLLMAQGWLPEPEAAGYASVEISPDLVTRSEKRGTRDEQLQHCDETFTPAHLIRADGESDFSTTSEKRTGAPQNPGSLTS
jgi:hypothetical protein